jgi:hypothetical protein
VGDHDRRRAGGDLEEAVVEGCLAADVELGGRLVEDEDAGAGLDGVEGAGEDDPLPLAAGEVVAAGVAGREDRVPAGGEPGDEGGRSGAVGGSVEGGLVDRAVAEREGDVLGGGEREAGRILVDDGDLPLPAAGVEPVRGVPSIRRRPAVGRRRPASRETRLVLPAPLRPTRPSELPAGSSRSIRSRAWVPDG